MIEDIACVILAGGKSSRMGEDKALLPFGSSPTLTQFQIEKFQKDFRHIYVSCKKKDKFNFGTNFIEDDKRFSESAPFIALVSTFEKTEQQNIFFLSVDTPFFEMEHFNRLKNQMKNFDAVVAKSPNGIQPLCAIYKESVVPHIIELIGIRKFAFAPLFERINIKFVEFEDEEIFTNLNTPDEYNKAMI